jgi:hypothetical protein
MKAADALKEALETAGGPGVLDALAEIARDAFKKSVLDVATAKPEVAGYVLNDALRAFDALRNILTLPDRCNADDDHAVGHAMRLALDASMLASHEWLQSPAHFWLTFMNGALIGRTAAQAATIADEALAEYGRRFGKASP